MMDVLLNELPNQPHHEGQEVLRVHDGTYQLLCEFTGGRYWLRLLVVESQHVAYTRMVKDAAPVGDVRKVGHWMLKQGR